MPRAYTPSANVAQMKESATIAASARAKALRAAGRPVIDLGVGEPDFDTPSFIRRAAQRAIDAGATRYTATEGILPLREAIAREANELAGGRGDPVTAGDVVVSTGSKQSLFNSCFVLFGAGDEVLVPTPSWTSYYEMVALAKAVPVNVAGDARRGLKVSAAALDAAGTDCTRGVMLNSPCNPTGAVYGRDELREILELAEDRGWWVISDEIYARIAYERPACSALEVARSRERLVVVNGVAKSFAMTGWRVGWAIAPRAVAQTMTALQSHTTSNVTTVSQHAALAALTERAAADAAVREMVERFRARRDAAVSLLADTPGPRHLDAEGAFYLYFDVSRVPSPDGDAGGAFARHLLEQHNVAVVPGSAFCTPGWVRLAYAAPDDQVMAGVARVAAAYAELVEGTG